MPLAVRGRDRGLVADLDVRAGRDLVDEVWDASDALVVRNKGEEARIRLSDIINVSYSPVGSPPRVTLSLRTPGRFGVTRPMVASGR